MAAPSPLASSHRHWNSSALPLPTAGGMGHLSHAVAAGFCSFVALQWGYPRGSQRCLCRATSSHAWLPRARCPRHINKSGELELKVARGFMMVQQPRVHRWGPNLTPPVPGAVPQQGGCPGMVLGGERDQALLLWGLLWQ